MKGFVAFTDDFCINLADRDYAYPGDCTLYYSCQGGVGDVMSCSEGYFFDTSLGWCNLPAAMLPERLAECNRSGVIGI